MQVNPIVANSRERLLKEAFQLLWVLAMHTPFPLRDMAQGAGMFNTMVRERLPCTVALDVGNTSNSWMVHQSCRLFECSSDGSILAPRAGADNACLAE